MNKRISVILIGILIVSCCIIPFASAAQYSIKEMTPEVENALVGRRNRYEELVTLKKEGYAGENNQGYVEVLGGDTNVLHVVDAENMNRKIIYVTIAKQNGLDGALNTIEKVFAGVQREKAQVGDMVQDIDGVWNRK